MQIHGTEKKSRAWKRKTSWLLVRGGMAQGLSIFFLNRNITAVYFYSLRWEMEAGWCPGQCGVCFICFIGWGCLAHPVCSVASFRPTWATLVDGHRSGIVAWNYLSLLVLGHSTSPFSLEIYCIKFSGFFFLKARNKGRFAEDLYEARAHIWSIFQRGKIKCWTSCR